MLHWLVLPDKDTQSRTWGRKQDGQKHMRHRLFLLAVLLAPEHGAQSSDEDPIALVSSLASFTLTLLVRSAVLLTAAKHLETLLAGQGNRRLRRCRRIRGRGRTRTQRRNGGYLKLGSTAHPFQRGYMLCSCWTAAFPAR